VHGALRAGGRDAIEVTRVRITDRLGPLTGSDFVPEYEYGTLTKERRYLDGALLHELRVPFGYWEAKDTNDDLDAAAPCDDVAVGRCRTRFCFSWDGFRKQPNNFNLEV